MNSISKMNGLRKEPGPGPGSVTVTQVDEEGAGQLRALLGRRSSFATAQLPFSAGRYRDGGALLSPGHDGTDGFFVARLVRA